MVEYVFSRIFEIIPHRSTGPIKPPTETLFYRPHQVATDMTWFQDIQRSPGKTKMNPIFIVGSLGDVLRENNSAVLGPTLQPRFREAFAVFPNYSKE